jgi:hypothetical protein
VVVARFDPLSVMASRSRSIAVFKSPDTAPAPAGAAAATTGP